MTNDDLPPVKLTDDELLASIRRHMPQLIDIKRGADECYEDGMYRYYHHSVKLFVLQRITRHMKDAFCAIGGGLVALKLHGSSFFMGRDITEAYHHAYYMLSMMIRYGTWGLLEKAPTGQLDDAFPPGWAAVLYLYNMR